LLSITGGKQFKEETMKTLIVGNGVIGTLYGWVLAGAGVNVTHYLRRGKCTAYAEGVVVDVLDQRQGRKKYNVARYAPHCVEEISPADAYELIVVPTNSYQTEDALRTLAPHSGGAVFLVFSTHWDGVEFIEKLVPRERYLLGFPYGGGTIRQGVYLVNLGNGVYLGEVDGTQSEKLGRVKTLFGRAGIRPTIPKNILHWLWLHNALDMGFWAGFAKYGDIKASLNDRELLEQCYRATQELIELCRRRGVNVRSYSDTWMFRMPAWVVIGMLRRLYLTDESMQRFAAHALESLPEAKTNYEKMKQTAQELGVAMPNFQALGAYLEDVPISHPSE
jgi:ketopantoate reductase